MGKTSERLEAYQTQMSIYAEQHKIILASDALDMIEQLQDDLKDDIEKVVAELESKRDCRELTNYYGDVIGVRNIDTIKIDKAIDIVRRGGVE